MIEKIKEMSNQSIPNLKLKGKNIKIKKKKKSKNQVLYMIYT